MVVDGVQTFTPPLLFEVTTLPKTRRFLCGDQVRFPSKEFKIEFSVLFCGGAVTAENVYPTCFALPALVTIQALPAAIAPSATRSMTLPPAGRLVKFAPLPSKLN